jgi:nucleoside-diphosphate-sugar epimerase
MVIGQGLLAKAFSSYKDIEGVLIFASGVSNSKENDLTMFEREHTMLTSYANTDLKLIYFSTISVVDESLKDSLYVQHKISMEKYIVENFKNYIVFRLPNVIGHTANKHTFFNSIKESILTKQRVKVLSNATRYLIDVDDLAEYLPQLIEKENKKVINVCFSNKTSVKELVSIIGTALQTTYIEEVVQGGSGYEIDNSTFLSYITPNAVGLQQNYNYIIVNKYINA